MARPKSWFETKEYSQAKRSAKDRSHGLWKFTLKTRDGSKYAGYYVGKNLPVRLQRAQVEQKQV
jgi:hypothetical protein